MARSAPAIVILGQGSLATARKLQQLYPDALIHGLAERVEGADRPYQEFGATLRQLYQQDTPIIALCAAGIVIRTLAPLLLEKGAEPPVLAVAEDGSAVVPLLGGLGGVNVMAREIAAGLGVAAAITTSGELRFGTCLLNPPSGYALGDLELGKRFVSDLLGGESVRIEGAAPWLAEARLPEDRHARLTIRVGSAEREPAANELLIYPRSVLIACNGNIAGADALREALHQKQIAVQSVACLLAADSDMASPALREAAAELGVPLRFAPATGSVAELAQQAVPQLLPPLSVGEDIAIAVASQPLDPQQIGRPRGRLAVIGLGPGAAELMVPAVKAELARANDILGYETYVRMAGPFRADQVMHCTDNREEMQRARHAFELAAQGRSVVVVSSGDPGCSPWPRRCWKRCTNPASRAGIGSSWKSFPEFPLPWLPPHRLARPWATTSACCPCRTTSSPGQSSRSAWTWRPRPTWPWRSITRSRARALGNWGARWRSCASTAPRIRRWCWGGISGVRGRRCALSPWAS